MENSDFKKVEILPPGIEPILVQMEMDLVRAESAGDKDILVVAKDSIRAARSALESLKTYIDINPFQNKYEEIFFFKNIKPLFQGRLLYWTAKFNIELRRPIGQKKKIEKYLRLQLTDLEWFFTNHADFYCYYRSGETAMDESYFLRENKAAYGSYNPYLDFESGFSTSHDWLVSSIYSNQLLQDYLYSSLSIINNQAFISGIGSLKTSLKWTASKANLIELIYALQSGGVYNNGNADIKEIASNFEKLFHVDLGNYYQVFNEIRLRKKSRSQLLDQLKEKLIAKMDDLDER